MATHTKASAGKFYTHWEKEIGDRRKEIEVACGAASPFSNSAVALGFRQKIIGQIFPFPFWSKEVVRSQESGVRSRMR